MPPFRSMSAIKPVKTERTHEENQERAYIAASRRSDRSLEARVESARRASEIHKKRTGRAFRVTEEDVMNEEMYEEEDEGLAAQMRRLHARLAAPPSRYFAERMQAYISSQVGMRAAFDNAMNNAAGRPMGGMYTQYPPNGQFMNPIMMQMQPCTPADVMRPPQAFNRPPGSFRTAPYPMHQSNVSPGIRPNVHNRSASIATPEEFATYQQTPSPAQMYTAQQEWLGDRRMSLPANNMLPKTPQPQQGQLMSPTESNSHAVSPQAIANREQSPQQMSHPWQPQQNPSPLNLHTPHDAGPLTRKLPMETQQLLEADPCFDPNDPALSGMLSYIPRDPILQQPFYSYNPNGKANGLATQKSQVNSIGLHQTLAPSQLDTKVGAMDNTTTVQPSPSSAATDSGVTPFMAAPSFSEFKISGFDTLKGSSIAPDMSGQVTPDEYDFMSYLNFGDDLLSPEMFPGTN